MAQNKTKPTDASVEKYIASRANALQRTDCRELMVLLKRVTRHSPRMWGPSIVGYGSYRYTYVSGRTGEAPLTGFAIRGRELVVYLMAEGEKQRSLLAKLGRHKMTKSCLYFKQLADIDRSTLEKLVVGSIADIRRRYAQHDDAPSAVMLGLDVKEIGLIAIIVAIFVLRAFIPWMTRRVFRQSEAKRERRSQRGHDGKR